MFNWSMMSTQDSNSLIMEYLINFNDYSMMILVLITCMLFYIFLIILFNNFINRFLVQSQVLEVIWTLMPMIVLVFLAFPSIEVLYLSDDSFNPSMTVKSIGHQWYWSYEYPEIKNLEFDSFMVSSENLFYFRLLDVDNRMVIPFMMKIRILVSSMDVIHSWTIPSIGVKMDAIPGRINQSTFFSCRSGLMYGQCSEICGANHSFMPISVETTEFKNFMSWLNYL